MGVTTTMKNKILKLSSILVASAAFLSLAPSQLKAQAIIGSDVKLPHAVAQPAPNYSIDLRREGVEGQVVVSFVVTPLGEVSNPVIVSSTDPRLGHPALAAISKWKYVPATKAGVPVATRVLETVKFELHDIS